MSAGPPGDADDAEVLALLLPAGSGPTTIAVIWATVDLDRAASALGLETSELPGDQLLGAFVRLARDPSSTEQIALVEPSTEGVLAATLARFGEGPVGRYVEATGGLEAVVQRAAAGGIAMSREAMGPFGSSRLVVRASPAGRHLVLVAPRAGTIGR